MVRCRCREARRIQIAVRLTRDHVVWAYRLLLDRDPENEDVIGPKLAGSRNTAELRHHLITSAEFRDKNRDFAHTNDARWSSRSSNTARACSSICRIT